MGCDIHIVLERKVDGEWLGLHDFPYTSGGSYPARERNYRRFAMLANVRGDGPEPKGMPSDASQLAKFLCDDYGSDGHSHSYGTMDEVLPIFVGTEYELDAYAAQYPASHFFGIEDDIDQHRIVYWFDN